MVLAQTAQMMNIKPIVYYLGLGLKILKKGEAEKIRIGKFPNLAEMINKTLDMKIDIYVCEASKQMLGWEKTDFISGVKIVGAATLNDLALEALKVDNDSWVIQIKTSGTANLAIEGLNTKIGELQIDDVNTNDDVLFVSLKCNDTILFDQNNLNDPNLYFVLENDSLIKGTEVLDRSVRVIGLHYADYSCDSDSIFELVPLAEERHSLLFKFDGITNVIDYSFNIKIPVVLLFISLCQNHWLPCPSIRQCRFAAYTTSSARTVPKPVLLPATTWGNCGDSHARLEPCDHAPPARRQAPQGAGSPWISRRSPAGQNDPRCTRPNAMSPRRVVPYRQEHSSEPTGTGSGAWVRHCASF